jgi:hypothetical protein
VLPNALIGSTPVPMYPGNCTKEKKLSNRGIKFSLTGNDTLLILWTNSLGSVPINAYRQGCGSGSGSGSKLKQNFRRQFPSEIFLKSKFELNQIKNTGVIHPKFFQKVVSAILYIFSGKFFFK